MKTTAMALIVSASILLAGQANAQDIAFATPEDTQATVSVQSTPTVDQTLAWLWSTLWYKVVFESRDRDGYTYGRWNYGLSWNAPDNTTISVFSIYKYYARGGFTYELPKIVNYQLADMSVSYSVDSAKGVGCIELDGQQGCSCKPEIRWCDNPDSSDCNLSLCSDEMNRYKTRIFCPFSSGYGPRLVRAFKHAIVLAKIEKGEEFKTADPIKNSNAMEKEPNAPLPAPEIRQCR